MALDLAVSRAITMVHVLERALHDQGFWSMRLHGSQVPARKTIMDDQIVFASEFSMPSTTGVFQLSLHCGDEPVLVRDAVLNGDTEEPFVVEWALSLPQAVAA